MSNKKMILIIEDEKNIRNFIGASLDTQGYEVKKATTGNEGLALALSYNPELIILDLGLPDMDGIELIKKIKELINKPIIVVSARDSDRDKVNALDLGAEDYMSKPFSIAELLARIRVIFRRHEVSGEKIEEVKSYEIDGLFIDLESRLVCLDGISVHLTPIEYKILLLLIKYSGKVLTHNFIIKEIWGGVVGNETQSLRVFMVNLRRKIEKNPTTPKYIITEVGVGYRFVGK